MIYNRIKHLKYPWKSPQPPDWRDGFGRPIVHLGRAVVRDTFNDDHGRMIARCYVTQGRLCRGAEARIIREGIIIHPPAERSVLVDWLARFDKDIDEVSEGFECELKISSFDDIMADDVVEAFRAKVES